MDPIDIKSRYYRLIIPLCLVLWAISIALGPHKESSGGDSSQSYSYDSAGRLTQVNYGDGNILTYTYDANGNILSTGYSRQENIFSNGFETALAYLDPLSWGK